MFSKGKPQIHFEDLFQTLTPHIQRIINLQFSNKASHSG